MGQGISAPSTNSTSGAADVSFHATPGGANVTTDERECAVVGTALNALSDSSIEGTPSPLRASSVLCPYGEGDVNRLVVRAHVSYILSKDGEVINDCIQTQIIAFKNLLSSGLTIAVSEEKMLNTLGAWRFILLVQALCQDSLKTSKDVKVLDPIKEMLERFITFCEKNPSVQEAWISQTRKDLKQETPVSLIQLLLNNVFNKIRLNRNPAPSGPLTRGGCDAGQGYAAPDVGRCACPVAAAAPTTLQKYNVTTGGAQNCGKVIEMILSGAIPREEDVNPDALLKAFNLQLSDPVCSYDRTNYKAGVAMIMEPGQPTKVLVQLTSQVNSHDRLKERMIPITAHVVLDTSGSMSTQANTKDLQSRWDLAKAAVIDFTKKLREGDRLGLMYFDTKPMPVMELSPLTEAIQTKMEAKIQATKPIGSSTDLFAAMEASVKQMISSKSDSQDKRFHTIILFTDAQANEGQLKESAFTALMEEAKKNGIGLIVVGMGAANGYDPGFNTKLVEILMGFPHCAYFYVSCKDDMDRFTNRLPCYLEPFAHSVNVSVQTEGDFKLVATDTFGNVLNASIPTLYLLPAEGKDVAGGGGFVQEYIAQSVISIHGDDGEKRTFTEGDEVEIDGEQVKISAIVPTGIKVEYAPFGASQLLLTTNATGRVALQAMRLLQVAR